MTTVPFASVVVQPETIAYYAPAKLGSNESTRKALIPLTAAETKKRKKEDCPICFEAFSVDKAIRIKGCNHSFHLSCINESLTRSHSCPSCRNTIGTPQGKCPSGSMTVDILSEQCPGFAQGTQVYQITYVLPNGIQSDFHDHPGHHFYGATRIAYLPYNTEGYEILHRLKYSWRHGLNFTVGTSLTSHQSDVVIWASIHHKTSLQGGPYGFPDPNFVTKCNKELDGLNVPPAAECKNFNDNAKPMQPPPPPPPVPPPPHVGTHSYQAPATLPNDGSYGICPSGTMTVTVLQGTPCPGLSQDTIQLSFQMPSGTQMAYHPSPGVAFRGATREAFLPNSLAGHDLLARLVYAWMHGHCFIVGTSQASGRSNQVCWSSQVPFKTALQGGGDFGYPDPQFLPECHFSLDALNIPAADQCP